VVVFIDDILVYSPTLEAHIQHLTLVFQVLTKHHFFIKESKRLFAQQSLEYPGHVITTQGITTDPSKVDVVNRWPAPSNVKELRGFLGLAGYYRRFIKNYGIISRPLTHLLKKGVLFIWSDTAQQAFEAVKQALTIAPVVALPDFNKPFVLEIDASNLGIGAVLLQDGHPIAYLNQSLNRTNQGRSTYEKECLAILLAVEKWHSYLQHREFIIRIDQRSLQHLGEQRLTNSIQHKAFVKLMGLQYKIQYKSGSSNRAADALSCCASKVVGAISTCVPSWQENLATGYLENEEDKKLLAALSVPGSHPTGFSLVDGLIRYKSRIWIGHNEAAQQHVLQALHVSGIGGTLASRVPVTVSNHCLLGPS
jgi:hypothetical protein